MGGASLRGFPALVRRLGALGLSPVSIFPKAGRGWSLLFPPEQPPPPIDSSSPGRERRVCPPATRSRRPRRRPSDDAAKTPPRLRRSTRNQLSCRRSRPRRGDSCGAAAMEGGLVSNRAAPRPAGQGRGSGRGSRVRNATVERSSTGVLGDSSPSPASRSSGRHPRHFPRGFHEETGLAAHETMAPVAAVSRCIITVRYQPKGTIHGSSTISRASGRTSTSADV